MKKALMLTLCLLAVLLVFAACAEEHQHTFDTQWRYDAEKHWHDASCEHTDLVSEEGAHVFEGGDTCTVCSYTKDHVHTFADTWTSNKTSHWHASTCGCQVKDAEAAHEKDAQGKCKTCGYQVCAHTYADTLTGDATHHWYAPTCGCEVEGKDKAEHVDADNDGKCETCEIQFCEHTWATEWSSDEDFHWYDATCGHAVQNEKSTHVNDDNNEECDICKAKVDHIHTFAQEWSSDENGHWYASTCEHPNTQEVKAHTGYEQDGVCDDCAFVVFKLYSVNFTTSGEVTLLDMAGAALNTSQSVKENTNVEFKVTVAKGWQLAEIANAEVSEPKYNEDGSATYTVVIKITADGTKITITANKLSAAEVIKEGSFTAEVPGGDRYYYTLSFTAEKAGEYAVVSYNTNFNVGDKDWVYASYDNNPFFGRFYYTVEAKAGETVNVKFFNAGWNAMNEEVKYAILLVDSKFELPSLKGEGYTIPTLVNVTVTITLPKKGLYIFTTPVGDLVWLEGHDDYSEGSVEIKVIEATKDNHEVTLHFRINDSARLTYDFSWDIVSLVSTANLTEGMNTVHAGKGLYTCYTFTATKTGTYSFSAGKDVRMEVYGLQYNHWETGEPVYGFMVVGNEVELTAGESYVIYTRLDPSGSATESFDGTVNVTYLGYIPAYDNALGGYNAQVGTVNGFNAGSEGLYLVTLPNGGQFSLDGENFFTVGANGYEVFVNGAVTYYVKGEEGATHVVVNFTQVKFEFTLNLSDKTTWTQTMRPGYEYTVTLSGSTKYKYYLIWSANLKVLYKGTEIKSGDLITGSSMDLYTGGTKLTIIYNGTETGTVEFVMENGYAFFDMNVNNNSTWTQSMRPNEVYDVYLSGSADGEYKLYWTDANITVTFNGAAVVSGQLLTTTRSDGQLRTLKITYTGEAKSEIVFRLEGSASGTPDTGMADLLNGSYVYKDDLGETLYKVSFANGVLTVTDNYRADFAELSGTYSYTYANGVLTIKNAEGTVVTNFSFKENEGSLVLVVGNMSEFALTVDKDADKPAGNTLAVGTQTVSAGGNQPIGYTFTATKAGTYVISWTDPNTVILIETANGSEEIGGTGKSYEFTLAAGESITFLMTTGNWSDGSYAVTITAK